MVPVVASRSGVVPVRHNRFVNRVGRLSVGLAGSAAPLLGSAVPVAASPPVAAEDFVFTVPMGGPLRRDLLYRRIIRPAVEKAGLPSGLRLHDLRHTCVSLLIQLGAHPKAIQERLGHSSITVTMDVYGHLFPSVAEALTERLDDVFRAARLIAPAAPPTVATIG